MSFFDSELVCAEMCDITELQEKIYKRVFEFPTMTRDEKEQHVDMLDSLLQKQRVLYTRISLSEDPEAKQMKQNLTNSARLMGFPENVDLSIHFKNMEKMVATMRQYIDKTSTL